MVLSMNTHVAGFVGKHPVPGQPSANKLVHRLRRKKGAVSGFVNNDPKTKLTRTQDKSSDHPGERIRPISGHQKRAGYDQPIGDYQFTGFKRTAFGNAFELIASDVVHARIIGASKSKAPHLRTAWLPHFCVSGSSSLIHDGAGDCHRAARLEREMSLVSRQEAVRE